MNRNRKHPVNGVCPMCTVERDQFPRSIKLTSSLLLLLLLLMFNTAVTAMHPPPPHHHPPPHQDDLGRPPVCLAGGRAELVESQNATVHPPASPDYHTTKLHIAPSTKPIQKPHKNHPLASPDYHTTKLYEVSLTDRDYTKILTLG